ncbi:MAG: helical backbone metal receptor [Chitinophagaceae bacterium]
MPVFIDQTGRSVNVPTLPQRIISLVPSQTELLYDLGLENEVIGITKFCVHPGEWFRSKTRVGGTKQLKMDSIRQLQPDLIIANKEENVKEQIEELEKHFPVWVSDVNDLPGAYEMIQQIGSITRKEKSALEINSLIRENFDQLQTINNKPQTIFLIWKDPYMTVGGDTFIHSMLEAAGFSNVYGDKKRYPEISVEELQSRSPDFLFLSSEPFPFKEKHAKELQDLLPGTSVILVDGELFSWYGSRLLQAPAYFSRLWSTTTW